MENGCIQYDASFKRESPEMLESGIKTATAIAAVKLSFSTQPGVCVCWSGAFLHFVTAVDAGIAQGISLFHILGAKSSTSQPVELFPVCSCFTVTLQVAFLPVSLFIAVMVTLPFFTAVTFPFWFTLATFILLKNQVILVL